MVLLSSDKPDSQFDVNTDLRALYFFLVCIININHVEHVEMRTFIKPRCLKKRTLLVMERSTVQQSSVE